MKLFISYSWDNKYWVSDFARKLSSLLTQDEVWFDQRLFLNQQWWDEILNQIERCETAIIILSPRYVNSPFCMATLEYVLAWNKPIMLLRMKECKLPDILKSIQYFDIETLNMSEILHEVTGSLGNTRSDLSSHLQPSAEPPRPPMPTPKDIVPCDPLDLLATLGELTVVRNPDPPSTSKQAVEPNLGTYMIDDKGLAMVYVPAGKFLMGSTQHQVDEALKDAKKAYGYIATEDWFTRELPQHEVVITRPFWLDLTPITNESFARFIAEGGYETESFWTLDGWQYVARWKHRIPSDYGNELNDPQQPRVGVTWYEAYAYCQWRGGRLPTEAEWEWAARGAENLIYPWGNEFDFDKVVWDDDPYGKPVHVGSKPAGVSWVGALDMCSNVWEWVQTIFDQKQFPYPYQESDGRNEAQGTHPRGLRGGTWWFSSSPELRSAYRGWSNPWDERNDKRFRAVRPYE